MQVHENNLFWIQENFPELHHRVVNKTHFFEGLFCFCGSFSEELKEYTFFLGGVMVGEVCDAYKVRIEIYSDKLPVIYETGGRIPFSTDYHKYGNGSVCAWGVLDWPESVAEVFDLALQFFFDQSYFQRHQKWPRGEYYHGELGLLQNYYQATLRGIRSEELCMKLLRQSLEAKYINSILVKRKIKGHHPCICGSTDHFRRCHPDVFKGMWLLQKHFQAKGV